MGVRRLNGWPRRGLGESALSGRVPPPGEPVKGGRTVETIGDVPPRMEQSCHPPQAAAKRAAPRSARSSARADGSSGSAGCGAELFQDCAVNKKQGHFVKICTLTPFSTDPIFPCWAHTRRDIQRRVTLLFEFELLFRRCNIKRSAKNEDPRHTYAFSAFCLFPAGRCGQSGR